MGGKGKKKLKETKNGQRFDPMAVTWAEKYDKQFQKIWDHTPRILQKVLVPLSVFLIGISINGDWLNIFVHVGRQFGFITPPDSRNNGSFSWSEISMESLKLKNFFTFWWTSCLVSYVLYFGIGGFLHWYYYVRQRDKAEDWKCQPTKWLSPDLEKHEIIFGSLTLFINASFSALIACYISNGGYSTIYYNISDYGWLWFFLQFPVIFIYQDYLTYWLHRMYHLPFLYKNFHKMHHKYKQPTAFSVTAIHPVESTHIQITLVLPIFIAPIHWLPFYIIAFYTYYHGIIDHSGVNFKSYWWQPWQPDAIFHDNHHQYFHVNFAFNIEIWDKLHGTYRRKDRVYTEDIYYGKGKALEEVSREELQADLAERNSENPLAYRDNENVNRLSQKELKRLNSKR